MSVAELLGSLTAVLLFVRVLVSLEAEFDSEDPIVAAPLSRAVNTEIDFDRFKESGWRAFAALWAAMRFQCFFRRFKSFLDPALGKICAMVLIASFAILLVIARLEGTFSSDSIAGLATVVNVTWLVLIEYAKGLKKAVERSHLND